MTYSSNPRGKRARMRTRRFQIFALAPLYARLQEEFSAVATSKTPLTA
jgi:hypothetical protein